MQKVYILEELKIALIVNKINKCLNLYQDLDLTSKK